MVRQNSVFRLVLVILVLLYCVVGRSQGVVGGVEEQSPSRTTSVPLVIELEHSVDDGETFTPRGKFTVTLNAEGKYTVSDMERNGIFAESIESFKTLLRQNDLYRIRTRSLPGSSTAPYVMAALPACELQKSGFKEDLTVFVGPNRNVVGFSYSSPVIALSRSCDADKVNVPTMLLSRIKVTEGETSMVVPIQAQGPKPMTLHAVDTGPFLDENLKMHGNTQGQGGAANQSFLRRYWYIVVFLIIYMIMRDDGPEPAAGEQKGGGGDTGPKKD
jgi:hypothetical protein